MKECKEMKKELEKVYSEMGKHTKKIEIVNEPINECAKKYHKYFKIEG